MTLDYAEDDRRRPPGWWAPWVALAIGLFGLLWMGIGWGGVLTSDAGRADAAGILLGMLTAAVLPGSMVGTFLSVFSVQRLGGPLSWVALTVNLLTAAAGVLALAWALA